MPSDVIHRKAVTPSVFEKWILRYWGPENWETLRCYIPRRWLRPENESELLYLLKRRAIAFGEFPMKTQATTKDQVQFFATPGVSIEWALPLLRPTPLMEHIHSRLAAAIVRRPDISETMLDTFISCRNLDCDCSTGEMAGLLFDCENKVVIDWALKNGYAPRADQLARFTRMENEKEN
jgi:hypothetical protein